jgi:hypothetical protein
MSSPKRRIETDVSVQECSYDVTNGTLMVWKVMKMLMSDYEVTLVNDNSAFLQHHLLPLPATDTAC